MVYDVDDPHTFTDIKNIWLKEVKMYCRAETEIFVFANKCDAGHQLMKDKEKKYCLNEKIKCYETSAKTGRNVNESFLDISKELMKKLPRCSESPMYLGLQEMHYEG